VLPRNKVLVVEGLCLGPYAPQPEAFATPDKALLSPAARPLSFSRDGEFNSIVDNS